MNVRQHWKPLLLVGALVLAGLVYVGQDRWRERCGAGVDRLSADDLGQVLLPRDRLAEEEGEVVAALDDLPAPFGDVVSGRVFSSFVHRPDVGSLMTDSVLLAGGGEWVVGESEHQLAVVDPASGKARWGLGTGRTVLGPGQVGDGGIAVAWPEGDATVVQGFDAESGDALACIDVGKDTETTFGGGFGGTVAEDGDVVVARTHGGAKMAITRVDPRSGEQRWTRKVEYTGPGVVVDDLGGIVVASSFEWSFELWGFSSPIAQGFMLTALDADSGAVAWTWPSASADDVEVQVKVVGTDPDRGRVHVVERVSPSDDDTVRLVTLSAQGEELWSRRISEYSEVALWGDRVVVARGEPSLTAYDAATGEQVWSTAKGLPQAQGLRVQAQPAVDLGDGTWLQAGADELFRVDARTGGTTRVVRKIPVFGYVSDVDVVGDHLVLSTQSGVFVMERDG